MTGVYFSHNDHWFYNEELTLFYFNMAVGTGEPVVIFFV